MSRIDFSNVISPIVESFSKGIAEATMPEKPHKYGEVLEKVAEKFKEPVGQMGGIFEGDVYTDIPGRPGNWRVVKFNLQHMTVQLQKMNNKTGALVKGKTFKVGSIEAGPHVWTRIVDGRE